MGFIVKQKCSIFIYFMRVIADFYIKKIVLFM